MIRAAFAGLVLVLLPGSAIAGAPTATEAKGAELLKPFKQSLMGALKEGMKKGPEAAVDTCHVVAPGIPDQTAPEGVKMGRTSHKVRNPDNAPAYWQKEIIQYYLHHEDRAPKTRQLEGGRVAYAEPIQVQAMCLMCHGKPEQIPAPVKAKLDELYPKDNATGFSEGDFRGIFWVTWPTRGTGANQ